jgi:hypothetical protein
MIREDSDQGLNDSAWLLSTFRSRKRRVRETREEEKRVGRIMGGRIMKTRKQSGFMILPPMILPIPLLGFVFFLRASATTEKGQPLIAHRGQAATEGEGSWQRNGGRGIGKGKKA